MGPGSFFHVISYRLHLLYFFPREAAEVGPFPPNPHGETLCGAEVETTSFSPRGVCPGKGHSLTAPSETAPRTSARGPRRGGLRRGPNQEARFRLRPRHGLLRASVVNRPVLDPTPAEVAHPKRPFSRCSNRRAQAPYSGRASLGSQRGKAHEERPPGHSLRGPVVIGQMNQDISRPHIWHRWTPFSFFQTCLSVKIPPRDPFVAQEEDRLSANGSTRGTPPDAVRPRSVGEGPSRSPARSLRIGSGHWVRGSTAGWGS